MGRVPFRAQGFALSWPPTSSLELQAKSSLCLAGSGPPTSVPKDLGFYF